jgi:hypothetical protein
MACLLLAASLGAPENVHYMSKKHFLIPLSVDDEKQRANIHQVYLHVSADNGASWQLAGVATLDKEGFTYTAPSEGTYSFKLQVEDMQGRKVPENLLDSPINWTVIVDTQAPQLKITGAVRQGGNLVVQWKVENEPNPDLKTLKLEYRTPDMPVDLWAPVALNAALEGQTVLPGVGAAAVSLRLQMKDLAGNEGSHALNIPAAAGIPPPPVAPAATNNDKSWSPTPGVSLPGTSGNPLPSAPDPVETVRTQPPPLNPVEGTSTGTNAGMQLVASTQGKTPAVAPATQVAAPRPQRGKMPELKYVNSRSVTLDYRVIECGPSGVGSVELYVTRDRGQRWDLLPQATDQDANSGDSKTTGAGQQRSLKVDLPGEGEYGFFLVVRSGAGLGKPPPQGGETPQMLIEVDETAPDAKLFAPRTDPKQRDVLILSWAITEKNPAPKPITLQWADQPTGPWKTIGEPQMDDNKEFRWKLTSDVPANVYLRLTVRDLAGNVGDAITEKPVLIDLHEPEAQLIGLNITGH